MWPPIVTHRETSNRNACINNLRIIDAAKEQWAGKHGHPNSTPVVIEEVNEWIKGGRTPMCPNGGTYSYNPVGTYPTCSLGEVAPKRVRVGIFHWQWSPAKHHQLK